MRRLLKKSIECLPRRTQLELAKHYFSRQWRKQKLVSSEIEYGRLSDWLKPGDVCVDVGANIGRYTLRMSELVGPCGHVFAFEPLPDAFNILSHMVNFASHKNISLMNAAVGEAVQMVSMETRYLTAEHDVIFDTNTQSSIVTSTESNTSTLCLSLDELHIPLKVDLVKIDVEGHELPVLKGMCKLILRDKPRIIVEKNSAENAQFLAGLEYQKIDIQGSKRNEVFEDMGTTY